MLTIQTAQRIDLTPTEEANLVAIVRATETALVADDEGNSVTRYFPTPEQDAALTTLTEAYIQDIRRAARAAKKIDRDEAEGIALEKFVSLVRDASRTNERLAGFVSKAMVNAVRDAEMDSTAVRIPGTVLRRFNALVHGECGGDLDEAYRRSLANANGIDALTLLAVHRALYAESVETALVGKDSEGSDYEVEFTDADNAVFAAASSPSPEEQVVAADTIAWLFSMVTEEQAQILRLHYGFTDTRSENQRLANGYQWDAPLSDAQIAPVLGLSRPTVNRRRTEGLQTMRDALNAALDV